MTLCTGIWSACPCSGPLWQHSIGWCCQIWQSWHHQDACQNWRSSQPDAISTWHPTLQVSTVELLISDPLMSNHPLMSDHILWTHFYVTMFNIPLMSDHTSFKITFCCILGGRSWGFFCAGWQFCQISQLFMHTMYLNKWIGKDGDWIGDHVRF